MSDRRTLRANARVVDAALADQADGRRVVEARWARVTRPVADLLAAPDGARDTQVLYGERFAVLENRDGWAFGWAEADGYVGYLDAQALGEDAKASHVVTAQASHLYSLPDIKNAELLALPKGARLTATGTSGAFTETAKGAVPSQHLSPVDHRADDPAEVALSYLGTPYLWGGRSSFGIDCSGLIQAALHACGKACPRDSDQQAAGLGRALKPEEPLQRGDTVFWKGHVGMMLDGETLLHANAHHMAVATEPLAQAEARILANEFGPVTGRRRP